jgi:hypothetical protein
MNVAMKTVVFLDVTPSTTESHLSVLKLELLQQVAKFNAGIQTGVPLMLKLVYPSCKEFLDSCWHHCTTPFCTLPSDCTTFGAAINDPKT